jgi:hypothetical protein
MVLYPGRWNSANGLFVDTAQSSWNFGYYHSPGCFIVSCALKAKSLCKKWPQYLLLKHLCLHRNGCSYNIGNMMLLSWSEHTHIVFFRSMLWLLVTANVSNSPILITLMMEVLTRATRRNIPEDGILHGHFHTIIINGVDPSQHVSISVYVPVWS